MSVIVLTGSIKKYGYMLKNSPRYISEKSGGSQEGQKNISLNLMLLSLC